MVEVGRFSKGSVVVDDRYPSLLISTFYGASDVELAQWHMRKQNEAFLRAAKKGVRMLSISDATKAGRPDPDARKFWADSFVDKPSAIHEATLGTFVVVNSAIIRGALTAIGWLNPKARELETFPSLLDALRAALLRLHRAGLPNPELIPTEYEVPEEFRLDAS